MKFVNNFPNLLFSNKFLFCDDKKVHQEHLLYVLLVLIESFVNQVLYFAALRTISEFSRG